MSDPQKMAFKRSSRSAYGDDCPSLYFWDKLDHLIKFPIRKYKLPKHYSDKVELERIPTLPLPPYRPLIRSDPLGLIKSNCMLVIGYREIYKKRLRIQFLRAEKGLPEDPLEPILPKSQSQLSILSFLAPGGGLGTGPKKGAAGKKILSSKSSSKGSSNKSSSKKGRPIAQVKLASKAVSVNKALSGNKSSSAGKATPANKDTNTKDDVQKKSSKGSVDPKSVWEKRKVMMRAYGRVAKAVDNVSNSSKPPAAPAAAAAGKPKKPEKAQRKAVYKMPDTFRPNYYLDDDIENEAAEKLDQEIDDELETVEPNKVTTVTIDPNLIEQPVLEQDFLMQNVPEVEEDERRMVFVTKKIEADEEEEEEGALVPKKLGTPDERDNEWLILSDTDSLERQDRREADKLYKQKPPSMIHGISYESQHFVEKLQWYLLSSKLTGRSPYYTRPNHKQKILEIVLHRSKEFIFFITSVILWLGFVLFFQAFIDILMLSGDDEYSVKEKNEINKYFVFIVFIAGQLGVVAIWGILLLLNYGLRLAHYINIWSVSLTEMETNAGKGIVRVTIYHHVVFLVYSIVIIVCFALEYPKSIKGCMGTITALFIRNFVPKVLESKDEQYLNMLRILGVALHLYVIYCVHITYTIIHILCIVLRNASEMWNLKFALRFGQIPVSGSGYLKQLRVRGTIMKLWLHHRLLNGLCAQLGDVFAMPLMLMFMVQLGIVTWCAVILFRIAYQTNTVRKNLVNNLKWFDHSMKYHSSRLEEVLSVMMVMGYMIYEFIVTASYLAGAGQAFRDGFEFVRRKGLILCNTSHERRLVQSLEWSFSATNAQKVSLRGFFSVTRETMLSFLTIALLLWSLIIQLQAENKVVIVVFAKNFSADPKGHGHCKNDSHGFCRKKIWVLRSDMENQITKVLNKGINDHLTVSRRRREVPNASDISIKMHWLQGEEFSHPGYVEGNCLLPLLTNLSHREDLQNYYLHFHEPCHSAMLNMTLMTPKLFDSEKNVWLGRNSVDCGLVPFPFRNSLYNWDCSGSNQSLYDDCGWKKSPADEGIWNQKRNESFQKIQFLMKSGRQIRCWNIISAVQRCRRIQQMGLEKVCDTRAYDESKPDFT